MLDSAISDCELADSFGTLPDSFDYILILKCTTVWTYVYLPPVYAQPPLQCFPF
jgi:hypothetical protein